MDNVEVGYEGLVEAILTQALKDYKTAIKKNNTEVIQEIEEYVNGDDYCGELIGITAPCMMRILKRQYRVMEEKYND